MEFSPATLIQVLRHRIRGGGGSRPSMILMTQGGVQNLGKPDDVILERSLIVSLQALSEETSPRVLGSCDLASHAKLMR